MERELRCDVAGRTNSGVDRWYRLRSSDHYQQEGKRGRDRPLYDQGTYDLPRHPIYIQHCDTEDTERRNCCRPCRRIVRHRNTIERKRSEIEKARMPVPAVSMLDATISRYAWSASNAGTHGIRRLNCGAPRNSTTTLIAVFLDTSLQPGYIFASSPSKTG